VSSSCAANTDTPSSNLPHNPQRPASPDFFILEITMADYYQQTVVHQIIPDADMTPLERLLLGKIFQSERVNDGWYFFAEENPAMVITIDRKELEQALEASPDAGSAAHSAVMEELAANKDGVHDVELDFTNTSYLDLSGSCWEFFLQDIVRRSKTLTYISVVTSFTCSKMRPDGFGGMAILITRDAIVGKSTNDILEDFIAEAGLDDEGPDTKAGNAAVAAPGE
jgi:hypothetical protein